jgi:hypothetical protein
MAKKTEEVIPMVDTINKDIADFAKAEDDAANKIFYESQGLQEDGKTPIGEEPPKEEPKKEGLPKEEPKKEEPPKEEPKKEDPPKEDEDLTKDLTVENATKRISAAQNKMHTSNKSAKDAVDELSRLQKENEGLKLLVDQKVTEEPKAAKKEEQGAEVVPQTDTEMDADLENLRKEYPEIAEPMIKMMQKQNAQNVELQNRLSKQEERETKREEEAKVNKENSHYNAIEDVHPDFNEISQEPLLDEWISGLDPVERVGAESIRSNGKTKDVISLLTKFKKANGYKLPGDGKQDAKTTPADSKLAKAKKLQTPQFHKSKELNTDDNPVMFTQEQMHKWTEKEWAENEEAVNEAMRNRQVR